MVPFWRLWKAPSDEWMNDIPPEEKSILVGFSRLLFFVIIMTMLIGSCTVIKDVYGPPDIDIRPSSMPESRLAVEIEALDNCYIGTKETAELIEKLIDKYDPVLEDLNYTLNTLTEEEILKRLEARGADKNVTTRILEAMRNH